MTDHRSPDQIERDLQDTRSDLEARLEVLQQRLDIDAIAQRAIAAVRGNGGTFARNLGGSVRDNPLPAALVGIGLAWLMAGGGNGRSAPGPTANDVAHGVGSGAGSARGKAGEMGARTTEAGAQARQGVAARAGEARARAGATAESWSRSGRAAVDRAGAGARQAGRSAGAFYEDNPLAVGAMALAAGALAAAFLPRTRREDETLGPLAERSRAAASEKSRLAGQEMKERGRAAAEAARRPEHREPSHREASNREAASGEDAPLRAPPARPSHGPSGTAHSSGNGGLRTH